LSISLDWTDLRGLDLEKNFLGTPYMFIILIHNKPGDSKSYSSKGCKSKLYISGHIYHFELFTSEMYQTITM
jgi:hypothetical protein